MAKFAKIIQENNENFLIKKFIRLFRRKIATKGRSRFSFVLTGGKSPIKLYKCLAKNKKIPWKKIDFFIGDERYVKENSKHSNICIRHIPFECEPARGDGDGATTSEDGEGAEERLRLKDI